MRLAHTGELFDDTYRHRHEDWFQWHASWCGTGSRVTALEDFGFRTNAPRRLAVSVDASDYWLGWRGSVRSLAFRFHVTMTDCPISVAAAPSAFELRRHVDRTPGGYKLAAPLALERASARTCPAATYLYSVALQPDGRASTDALLVGPNGQGR